MKLDSVRKEGGNLIISTQDPEAARFVYSFKPGDYDIAKAKKKRSLDSNAYCWVLIDKIAAAVRADKITVYREAIRNIAGNTEFVCVKDKAVDKLRTGWEHNGYGWLTDTMPSKIQGCTNVILTYGSSTYDQAQMSQLIDIVVEEAKSLGIETLTPAELERMKSEWQ